MSSPSTLTSEHLLRENETLRARLWAAENQLEDAQEVIRAIQSGEVDAVVVNGPGGEQVFTLTHSEHSYRALIEAMNEGAATLARDGTILYCNRRLSDLLAIPLERMIGRLITRLVAEEEEHVFEALINQTQVGGGSCTMELDMRNAEGERVPVHISLSEMQGGEPTALCMVVTDLTERKRTEDLLEAGELATSILGSTVEAIAVCDPSGKIITCNAALGELCGGNPLFRQFDDAFKLDATDQQSVAGEPGKGSLLMQALNGVTFSARNVRLQRSDGSTVPLLLSGSPIRGSSSKEGCVLTLTDITERELAVEALLRSEKLATVGRMASTIAHEINNPLEAIGQLLYLAQTSPTIGSEVKVFLDMAVEELDRISHITRQTLAFHRDPGKPVSIDLRENVDGVLRLFGGRLKSRGIQVATRYKAADPVRAMSSEVRQVISNLVSNSMDAVSGSGRIEIRLSRSFRRDGSAAVRFTVADSGCGMTRVQLQQIYEPFFTTKEKVGVGLGLWVTSQILAQHGAPIQVKSRIGKGTVFSILFPVEWNSARAA